MNQMAISHEESLATLESTLLEQHRAEIEAIDRQLRNEMAEVGLELKRKFDFFKFQTVLLINHLRSYFK